MIAIVAGALANKARQGGFAWVPLSYIRGLRRLGYDVYFVEQIRSEACVDDVGRPCPFERSINRGYLLDVMAAFDMSGRYALICDDEGETTGMSRDAMVEVANGADVLVNLSGHLTVPDIFGGPRLRVYVDLDPGFTQHWHRAGRLGPEIDHHEVHFSVATNIGRPECGLPNDGIDWLPTVPPVVLADWPVAYARELETFTTVGSWRCPAGILTMDGRTFPGKLHEFRRLLDLPALAGEEFEIALDIHPGDEADRIRLQTHGWRLANPRRAAGDPRRFQRYVAASLGECSAAQGVYVETRSGWFSDRSVRYLAAGRPALVQNTGFGPTIPEGEGVVAFTDLEGAVAGVRRIVHDPVGHREAARWLAETIFDSDRVLGAMLDRSLVVA